MHRYAILRLITLYNWRKIGQQLKFCHDFAPRFGALSIQTSLWQMRFEYQIPFTENWHDKEGGKEKEKSA